MGTQSSDEKPGLLDGVRVIVLSHYLAGPHCTRLLADMGAEVIKVENPGVGDPERLVEIDDDGFSDTFIRYNAGKKSLAVDIRKPEGLAITRELIRRSHVVIENRRPGSIADLGLGYQELQKLNPSIVMCSISGYGQSGPFAQRGAYAGIIQSWAGFTGLFRGADGAPKIMPMSLADINAGIHATAAICAALFHCQRTGKGQFIDISMFDCMVSIIDRPLTRHLAHGKWKGRDFAGYGLLTEPYKCGDSYIHISLVSPADWGRITKAMGRPDLGQDPRFQTEEQRLQHAGHLRPILAEWFESLGSAEKVIEVLDGAGVPVSLVATMKDVIKNPQFLARQLAVEIEEPFGTTNVIGSPFKFSDTEATVRGAAPALGQHTREILEGVVGYDDSRINQLKERGIIGT